MEQEMEQEYHTPCPFSQGHVPSGRTRIEQIRQQFAERAECIAIPSQQAAPLFEQKHCQMAMEAAGVGMYDWDIVRNQHVWSNECKALLGLSPDAQEDFAY